MSAKVTGEAAVANWPNGHTAATFMSAGISAVTELVKTSLQTTLMISAPFRLYSVGRSIQDGSCCRLMCSCLAVGALFFPYSRFISVGIDVVSECMNGCVAADEAKASCQKARQEASRIASAYQTLGLSEKAQVNLSQLIERYDGKTGAFSEAQVEDINNAFRIVAERTGINIEAQAILQLPEKFSLSQLLAHYDAAIAPWQHLKYSVKAQQQIQVINNLSFGFKNLTLTPQILLLN